MLKVHEDDLADVVVAEVAPINFGTHEILGGEFITRQLNLGQPWSNDDFVDFLEALGVAYDNYRRLGRELNDSAQTTGGPNDIRVLASAHLLAGESMVDVPALLEVPWDDLIWAISGGNQCAFYAVWGDIEWLKFEALIAGKVAVPVAEIRREFGLSSASRYSIGGLLGLYGKVPERRLGELDELGKVVLEAVRDGITDLAGVRDRIAAAGLQGPTTSKGMRMRIRSAQDRVTLEGSLV